MRKNEFKLRQREASGISKLDESQINQVKSLLAGGEFSKKAIKSVFGLSYDDLKVISKSV